MIRTARAQLQVIVVENEGVAENVPPRSVKDYATPSLGGTVSCI